MLPAAAITAFGGIFYCKRPHKSSAVAARTLPKMTANHSLTPRERLRAARNAKKDIPKKQTDAVAFPRKIGSSRGAFAKNAAIPKISLVNCAKTEPNNPALAGKSGTTNTDTHAKPKHICAGKTPIHDAAMFPSPNDPKTL